MIFSAYFLCVTLFVTMVQGCGSDSTKPVKPSAQDEKDVGDNVDSNIGGEIDTEDDGENGEEGGEGDKSESCAHNPTPFVSIWQTREDNEKVTLPLVTDAGDYNITVNWGDGKFLQVSNDGTPTAIHTYESVGEYIIRIEGYIGRAWSFAEASKRQGEGKTYPKLSIHHSKYRLRTVIDLGSIGWKSLRGAFSGVGHLKIVAGGCTDEVTDITGVFKNIVSGSYLVDYYPNFPVNELDVDFRSWNFSSIASGDGLSEIFLNNPSSLDFVDYCNSSCTELSNPESKLDCNNKCEDWTGSLTTESYSTLLKRLADTPENGGLRDDVVGVVMTVPAQYSHEAGVARLELEYNHNFTFYDLGQDSSD